MGPKNLIEQELAAAEEARKIGNEGKARVCARRAVTLADEAWLAKQSDQPIGGDVMAHLRRIQQDHSLPLSIREAAERLSTAVTRKGSAPFTTDPIGDARIFIAYLSQDLPLRAGQSLGSLLRIRSRYECFGQDSWTVRSQMAFLRSFIVASCHVVRFRICPKIHADRACGIGLYKQNLPSVL